jgi:hypothetical protein
MQKHVAALLLLAAVHASLGFIPSSSVFRTPTAYMRGGAYDDVEHGELQAIVADLQKQFGSAPLVRPDRTHYYMKELDLPTHPPAFGDLAAFLVAGLHRKDGTKASFPVHENLYYILTQQGHLHRMIEPQSRSDAFTLGNSISATLRRRILQPSDEITQAGTCTHK